MGATPLRVAVQGFGNVGYNMAKFLHEAGFLVVAVSDSKGGIYVEEGINPELTLACKKSMAISLDVIVQDLSATSKKANR